jgi:DNA-binding transcriptional LysR family regulator
MMRVTLKHLEYFVAAGDLGSIKLASDKINISQPSISSAITHLEREFGLQLFVRHHAQGLSLTASGLRMMREAKVVLKHAQELYVVAGELKGEISGPLSVGCLVTLAPMIVPELGHEFMKAHAGVQLRITEGNHEKLLDQLRQVEIDAAITYNLQAPDDVVFEPLASLPPQILISKAHPLAKKKSVRLRDIDGLPMVLLDLPYSRQYFYSIFQNEGLTANVVVKSANQEVVRTMVANGYGFTIANVRPKNLAALDGRKLVALKLEGRHASMTIGIATLQQEHKTRVLDAFEQHCRELINENQIPGMTPVCS